MWYGIFSFKLSVILISLEAIHYNLHSSDHKQRKKVIKYFLVLLDNKYYNPGPMSNQ